MHHRLYVSRRERGLFQKEVAKWPGVLPQTYHEMERGKVEFTHSEAKGLSKLFECTLDELFSECKDKEVTVR